MLWWGLLAAAFAFDELGEGARPTGRTIEPTERFARADLLGQRVVTDPAALGRVAHDTASALRTTSRTELVTPGVFGPLGLTMDDVLRTLDLVARVADEDAGQPTQRLASHAFLQEQFDAWAWSPDTTAAAKRKVTVTPHKLRLTKYLVYQVKGSREKTTTYTTALYASPDDPSRLTAYTRMDAYAGIFEPGGAAHGLVQPLVYLTREGVNQALMQGTVEVALTDGSTQLYNVHRNNGMAWNSSIKDPNKQGRYWTFREVQGVLGVEDIPLADHVAVAGDIYNVGLGKLVAIVDDAGVLRLAVLADTGGAFQPNLFQLDWFAGAYPSHAAFAKGTAHLPVRARAMVLVAKP